MVVCVHDSVSLMLDRTENTYVRIHGRGIDTTRQ